MGATFRSGRAQLPEGLVASYLNGIIERDRASRQTEQDMYRGDFGSSSLNRRTIKTYDLKTNTQAMIDKRYQDFVSGAGHQFEKYVMDWSVIGQLGYIAYTTKVVLPTGLSGPLYIRGLGGKGFKNVTELRAAVRNNPTKEMVGKAIYLYGRQGIVDVGRIEMDCHIYKTKPAKRPDKYNWLERYIEVAYGGFNPY